MHPRLHLHFVIFVFILNMVLDDEKRDRMTEWDTIDAYR